MGTDTADPGFPAPPPPTPPPPPHPRFEQPEPPGRSLTSTLILLGVIASILVGMVLVVKGVPVAKGRRRDDKDGDLVGLFGKQEGIVIVRVYGPIEMKEEKYSFGRAAGADGIVQQLEKVRKDKRVLGVVLRVNSPGGTVAASQEIHRQVKELTKKMPVVVSMGDVCASGGYYISAPATFIFANPGTITGSIGVITQLMMYEELIKKIGVTFPTYKSGQFKDMGAGHRPPSKEEEGLFQGIVTGAYEQFLDAVCEGRIYNPATQEKGKVPTGRKAVLKARDEVRKVADGRVYLGREARRVGLVDEEGDLADAIKKAGVLAGLGETPTIIKLGSNFEEFMESFSEGLSTKLVGLDLSNNRPPVAYLYRPGL
ncbi:MAG: signal peptide peptidase SppA [Candidatus Riflebacteria bacterium]|nr:signal peptide peptidase SppA [Candidatus Riflebacteria bacterium]